ncbi:tripartite tricarboxylate transporter permease [Vagococcus sp. BWB3-3]|uniref:Tripartite tricarboxylate transporter permease n=1 Tax=Vagococcus allomyrinae TaxID=2794353 RepID=A0A940SUY4_9ENTE|nr:tripartite tricarboxylate transporter permease [Vagococcus allomyrinae]MBP1041775.1 tripartite tricarboxylate transporter permease [Vagococcus allomyrinae]
MELSLLIQMVMAACGAIVLYIFLGFIPGTDETSILMPIALALILGGIHPIVALTFFVASFVTLGLMNLMPVLIVGLPGGVMSTPLIEYALLLKEQGRTTTAIKKAAVGSLIGVLIALPTSLAIAHVIAPYANGLKEYASWLFIGGAIFLSLIGKSKIISLISIIPMALLFQGLRTIYWSMGVVPETKNITTSFFLGITIAPLLLSLVSLFNQNERDKLIQKEEKITLLPLIRKESLNPFNILSKKEAVGSIVSTFLACFLFVLSPVGLTILFGEMAAKRETTAVKKAEAAVVTMSALVQGTYMSGLVICLVALGIPLAPSAIGPGAAFFEAPPIFEIGNTITSQFPQKQLVLAFVIGTALAIGVVYLVAMRFASKITSFVLRKIPHEGILGLFIALVVLLGYMDAGLINVFGILLIGFTCGTLNRLGVNYGIQFMTLYAAPAIIEIFSNLV